MFGLGFPELLIILVIILVIFGAGKLPQVGEALGKGLNKFRTAMDDKPEKSAVAHSKVSETAMASDSEKEEEKVKKD